MDSVAELELSLAVLLLLDNTAHRCCKHDARHSYRPGRLILDQIRLKSFVSGS